MMSRVIVAATVKAVKNKRLVPSRAALVLTKSAVNQIKKLLEGKPDCIGLKIGVKQRGCNGLSYTLDYAKDKGKLDEEVTQDEKFETYPFCEDHRNIILDFICLDENKLCDAICRHFQGVRVLIDAKAQLTLLGTEMDYVETNLASEFVFNNPNIKGTCGCGESFSI